MALQVTGQAQGVVLTSSQKSGAPGAISTGWHNEAIVSELMPRFGYAALAGYTFSAEWPSAATAAASATSTGAIALFNPSGSGKNIILLNAAFVLNAVAAATTVLVAGYQAIPNQTPTARTATTAPTCMNVGSGNLSVASALTAGTVAGAPTATPRVGASWYSDLVATGMTTSIVDVIDGAIVIAPNSTLAIVSVAGTPTLIATMTWLELPI